MNCNTYRKHIIWNFLVFCNGDNVSRNVLQLFEKVIPKPINQTHSCRFDHQLFAHPAKTVFLLFPKHLREFLNRNDQTIPSLYRAIALFIFQS